jgi:hypothetical protein
MAKITPQKVAYPHSATVFYDMMLVWFAGHQEMVKEIRLAPCQCPLPGQSEPECSFNDGGFYC